MHCWYVLTEQVVWVRKEEGVEGEEEQIHQVGHQVEGEGDSAVYSPLVCEETGHHWVLQELSARIVDLSSKPNKPEQSCSTLYVYTMCMCSYTEEGSCKLLKRCSQSFLAMVNLELSMNDLSSQSGVFKKHETK